jgi:hypothetical protein
VTRRWLAFALRVMRRYRLRAHASGGPRLVLRQLVRQRPSSVLRAFLTRRVRSVIERGANERRVVRRHELRTQRLQHLLTIEHEGPATFFERIASRSERVERSSSTTHTPPGRELHRTPGVGHLAADGVSQPGRVSAPTPRELVIRRARIDRREQPAAPAEASRVDVAATPGRAPAPPVLEPPAVDVGRLADQVIDVIDRRIVAQRERLGRP